MLNSANKKPAAASASKTPAQKTNIFSFFGAKPSPSAARSSSTPTQSNPAATLPGNADAARSAGDGSGSAPNLSAPQFSSPAPVSSPTAAPTHSASSVELDISVTQTAASVASSAEARSQASQAAVAPPATPASAAGPTSPASTPAAAKPSAPAAMDDSDDDGPISVAQLMAQRRGNEPTAASSSSGGSSGATGGSSSSSSSLSSGSLLKAPSPAAAAAAAAAAKKPAAAPSASKKPAAAKAKRGGGSKPAAKKRRTGGDGDGDDDEEDGGGDDGDSAYESDGDDDDDESVSLASEDEESEPDDDFDDEDDEGEYHVGKKGKGAAAKGRGGSKAPKGKAAAKSPTTGVKRKREPAASPGGGAGGADDGDGAGEEGGDGGSGEKRAGVFGAGQHTHDKIDFLQPDKIRDASGKRRGETGYNPRTLYVPPAFLSKQTGAQEQWWLIKSSAFDTVLFFKQGKFYECFHMDADVVVKELGLIYMKGEGAHAGFPEISYGLMSDRLVSAGYRVARVEQVETPQQLDERNKAAGKGKKDKVVRREICGIKSKGTRTCGVLDVYAGFAADSAAARIRDSAGSAATDPVYGDTSIIASSMGSNVAGGNCLYAIKELPLPELSAATAGLSATTESGDAAITAANSSSSPVAPQRGGSSSGVTHRADDAAAYVHLGVVVADSQTGDIRIAEFVDDRARTRLRTLMARYPPGEFLYPADTTAGAGLSTFTRRIMKYDAPLAVWNGLLPSEWWTAAKTADELQLKPYTPILAGAAASAAAAAASGGASGPAVRNAPLQEARQRDYFRVAEGDAAVAALTASGAASSGSAVPVHGGAFMAVPGPDGTARLWPTALWETLQRAAADGFEPRLPALEGAASAATRDVPPAAAALQAVGAAIFWLRRSLIDHQVFSMRRFTVYHHADGIEGSLAAAALHEGPSAAASASTSALPDVAPSGGHGEGDGVPHMVLDGTTLLNLEILENSFDGSRKGTLLALLDSCVTPMGRRRFKQWLCAPLLRPADIEDRLAAVDALMSPAVGAGLCEEASSAMRGMPDIERLLARIHGLGSLVAARDHPDARAVMYETDTYNKRKINDLLQALKAFTAAAKVRELFHVKSGASAASSSTSGGSGGSGLHVAAGTGTLLPGIESHMLIRTVHSRFPDLSPLLSFFSRAFDAKEAEQKGTITPRPGVDAAYDRAVSDVAAAQEALEEYLETQKAELRCRDLKYWGSGKDRFQIEVPEALSSRVPDHYSLRSKKKGSGKVGGVWRYWTSDIEEMLATLTAAEDRRDVAVKDGLRRLFERFDAHKGAWEAAASCCATLDCLLSLTRWSARGDGGNMCRPQVVSVAGASGAAADADGDGDGDANMSGSSSGGAGASPEPFLLLQGARHPTLAAAILSGDTVPIDGGATSFIPNDVRLGAGAGEGGADVPACVLLSGPNMGGKSTYLRLACVSVILAQLGAYVPADSCKLTPVDRIFTRVGATDRILAGQSTFFVELAETSTILSQATRHSLVLLDELGRGTSTFDGNAIAYAVTDYLTRSVRCRTLFATHYHTLCEDFEGDARVALGHMDCLVEERPDGTSAVTFLYRYAAGACPKSYGLNVARLAKLPESVILRAKEKSEEFERSLLEAEHKA